MQFFTPATTNKKDETSTTNATGLLMGEVVNNLSKTAIEKIISKLKAADETSGYAKVTVKATWKKGIVTGGANGKLICYAPPEIQLSDHKLGPSVNSYCPLISGGCFSLIMMMDAAQRNYHFETFGTNMTCRANFAAFYNPNIFSQNVTYDHPWQDGVLLDILIRGEQTHEEMVELAEYSDEHCPSSEIMKRAFPVLVDKFDGTPHESIDWDSLPVYYDMDAYNELATKTEVIVDQRADMTWHCQNECVENPDSLMTFHFPNDSDSYLTLSHDQPISSGKYANPVQACFFGGLSSFLHTVAARIYAKGYKVECIDASISAKINKRKVFGIEHDGFVFPEGASIEVEIVTNAPNSILETIQREAENMSPTMMNWENELPLKFEVLRLEPKHRRRPSTAESVQSSTSGSIPDEINLAGKRNIFSFLFNKKNNNSVSIRA